MACKKCGKPNGWDYLDCLCVNCKKKRCSLILLISLPIMILSGLIGGILGEVNYNYELDKCNTMTNEASAYEFTHDLQHNAEYNQECFELKEHPLSHFSYTGGGAIGGVVIILVFAGMSMAVVAIL